MVSALSIQMTRERNYNSFSLQQDGRKWRMGGGKREINYESQGFDRAVIQASRIKATCADV